jgi:hypothetical protein
MVSNSLVIIVEVGIVVGIISITSITVRVIINYPFPYNVIIVINTFKFICFYIYKW